VLTDYHDCAFLFDSRNATENAQEARVLYHLLFCWRFLADYCILTYTHFSLVVEANEVHVGTGVIAAIHCQADEAHVSAGVITASHHHS
jgi:hypothetical protein